MSMRSEASPGFHCRRVPSAVIVAWSPPTGGGASPAALKAAVEGPADRSSAFRTSILYVSSVVEPVVRGKGRMSIVCEGPGATFCLRTGVQAEGAVIRQSSIVIGFEMVSPSVVLEGLVQRRCTSSPTRSAARSAIGLGRCSEGGRGVPGLAQPLHSVQNRRRVRGIARLQADRSGMLMHHRLALAVTRREVEEWRHVDL